MTDWLKLALAAAEEISIPCADIAISAESPPAPALSALSAQPPENDWQDEHAERAAVVQYDGGVPAAYADAFAMIQMRCPDNVPVERWRQFIDDAGRFFDRWGAVAEHLGWTVSDLLGFDPRAPMARYDAQGLIWIMQGDDVVLLAASTATLSRAGLKFRRTLHLAPATSGHAPKS